MLLCIFSRGSFFRTSAAIHVRLISIRAQKARARSPRSRLPIICAITGPRPKSCFCFCFSILDASLTHNSLCESPRGSAPRELQSEDGAAHPGEHCGEIVVSRQLQVIKTRARILCMLRLTKRSAFCLSLGRGGGGRKNSLVT